MAADYVDIKPSPPVCCLENDINDIQISALQEIIRELEATYGVWVECSKVSLEYHLLSKGVIKMKHRHRSEKFKGYLKKVENGLKKLSRFDLPSVFKLLLSLCPRDPEDIEGLGVRLPSQQMFFFLMHRMHKAAELIQYLMENCINAYGALSQQVKLGIFVSFYMLHMSNVAGIWFILRAYMKSVQNLYCLIPDFAKSVKATQVPWVSEILPKNLDEFLPDTTPMEMLKSSPVTERLMSKIEGKTDSANFTEIKMEKIEDDLGESLCREELEKIVCKRKNKEVSAEGGKKMKMEASNMQTKEPDGSKRKTLKKKKKKKKNIVSK